MSRIHDFTDDWIGKKKLGHGGGSLRHLVICVYFLCENSGPNMLGRPDFPNSWPNQNCAILDYSTHTHTDRDTHIHTNMHACMDSHTHADNQGSPLGQFLPLWSSGGCKRPDKLP